MRNKTNLSALAAAVGLSLAMGAHAAPIVSDLGGGVYTGTGDGNLVLAMYDGSNKSLVFNTGWTVNTFQANSNHDIHVAIASADLTSIDNFLGGVDTSKLHWNLTAVSNVIGFDSASNADFSRIGLLTTGVKGSAREPVVANGPGSVDPELVGTPFGRAKAFYDGQNSVSGNPLATGNVVVRTAQSLDDAASYKDNWVDTNGNAFGGSVSFANEGTLGSALSFYFYHGTGIDPGVVTSTLLPGKWTFAFNGGKASLDYVVPAAPVPVPGAVWLLGSCIAALAARRRQAS